MPSNRWVAIDFETATREATSACALGIAVIEGLEIVDEAAWLIRPPFNDYDYQNTAVHGLSAEDTEDEPEFEEVWGEIRDAIGRATLLAHNAPFDMRVLRALIATRELAAPDYEYACTVALSRRAWPSLRNHRLDTVCEHCGIDLVHHEAESDARACARVAIEGARSVGASNVDQAMQVLGLQIRRLV
ncbi:MAG TPA: 3'-5' exonuclease [Coriobacteriia bacterium]|nr:3'-5' exonuclease [Coriobacteriia bacterium]